MFSRQAIAKQAALARNCVRVPRRAFRSAIGMGHEDVSRRRSWPAVVAGFAVFQLAAHFIPPDAVAQCATTGGAPVTFTCAANTATTATTNTISPNPTTSDRTQRFNADLIGQINGGVTVSGVGLDLVTTKVGGGITFTNSGAISTTAAPNALQLDGNGGTVTYT